jgi:hypothetical protein
MRSIRVKLVVDLSRYDSRLTGGQEGDAYSDSYLGDCFAFVRFDCGAGLDVLWNSLDIIDEEYLAEVAQRESEMEAKLATARDAILHLGPRGGFRCLSYFIPGDGHTSLGFKEKAMKHMGIMERHGIEIREERGD